jgi:hypothetical protein
MEKLVIKWQRLVEENKTCPRCGDTEKELERAFLKLKDAFALLNIEVILEKIQLSKEDFKRNPLSSNQIWINIKPLEFWINAGIGNSRCCDVCGDENCRTIELSGKSYETVPENLIIKASILALADMIKNRLIHIPKNNLNT